MNSIESLVKFIKHLIDKATELDPDGIEYFKDLTIPACEITDLYDRVKKAEEELQSKDEERLWQLFLSVADHNITSPIVKVFDHSVKALNVYKDCLEGIKKK